MLKPGVTYTENVAFKQEDVEAFARITGDYNPIHFDGNYARRCFLKKEVVHGMLAVSMLSGIIGSRFPGEGSILMYREIRFIRPVYVGEDYTMHFVVKDIDYSSHQGVIKSTIKNKKGQVLLIVISRIKHINEFSADNKIISSPYLS